MPRGSLASRHVVLVDEPSAARDILQAVLEGEGATVSALPTAPDAMSMLGTVVVDAVVTAIRLGPGLADGLWWFEQIRGSRDGEHVPVIALTAGNPSELAGVGFVAVLVKPVNPLELVAIVIGALGTTRADR